MRFLFVSDSFRGALSSAETAEYLARAAREVFGEDVISEGIPVADGGEGTLDAVWHAAGGNFIEMTVTGAAGYPVTARYLGLDRKRAVIEMAEASGLARLPREFRNPLYTSSTGTGELIKDALKRGFSDITVALGGSATNDGGMGALTALGVVFRDMQGRKLAGRGTDLAQVRDIDVSGQDPRLRDVRIRVMTDVRNPLTGPGGATMVFGAQKGGTPEMLEELENGMCNYRERIIAATGRDPDDLPGAGAAGGLGAALGVLAGGRLVSGIDTVLDLIDFEGRLAGADLVITGEGCTDRQSCYGKVMQAVGERARKSGVPAVGLSGSLGAGGLEIMDHGIASVMTAVAAPMTLETALARAPELYYSAALRMFRFLRTGMEMGRKI